ncbi:exonuclease domain-containing protein [Tundrisphaera lichenicola]|uniref:3'-5' exonuclease n=1 Tax=Tundrisphaera lichenicola TaxID=2029860 RepID=UPI003EBAB963
MFGIFGHPAVGSRAIPGFKRSASPAGLPPDAPLPHNQFGFPDRSPTLGPESVRRAMEVGPPREFVAFDLETTGLSAESDRIVEVGAVKFDESGRELDVFESLVNPLRPSSPTARAIHGISDVELAAAETAETVLADFVRFLGDPSGTTLMAHNASFDAGFLGRELARLGRPMPGHAVIDTLAMSRKRWPELRTHKLDFLARRLGLDPHGPHRALADSRRVRGLWLAIVGPSGEDCDEAPLAYPIFDARSPLPAPRGWDRIERAIGLDQVVRIEYAGGTRGLTPREITPRRFSNRGGVAYLVALCHLDAKVKEFRLDRVRNFEVIDRPD